MKKTKQKKCVEPAKNSLLQYFKVVAPNKQSEKQIQDKEITEKVKDTFRNTPSEPSVIDALSTDLISPSPLKKKNVLHPRDCNTENVVEPIKTNTESLFDDIFVGEWDSSFLENTPPFTQQSPSMKVKRKAKYEQVSLQVKKSSIDLSLGTRCTVERVTNDTSLWETNITVKCLITKSNVECKLKGVWYSSPINVSDVFMIQAVLVNGCWTVDNDNGYISLYPDILISSTSLVNGMYCRRKSVLMEMFRGLDSENKHMVIGKLSHEILQRCLQHNIVHDDEIEHVMHDCLNSQESIHMLYSCGLSYNAALLELTSYCERVKDFIKIYLNKDNSDSGLTIQDVVDIEETIISPRLGVKGRIDVTVRIKHKQQHCLVPLEIKTGRASFSNEHISQVTLYVMMMSEHGEKIDSGLLLYLKENLLQEIKPTWLQKRDLILLRNDYVKHLVRPGKTFGIPYLPQAVYKPSCNNCPYKTVCCTFLKSDGIEELSTNSSMYNLFFSATQHLDEAAIDYFFKWSGLIKLEDNKQQTNIWTMSEDERTNSGAVFQLKLESVTKLNDEYIHTFTKSNMNCKLTKSEYVVVSTRTRYTVASGHMHDITDNMCKVILSKDLSIRYKNEEFVIDLGCFNKMHLIHLTSLSYLLDDNQHANKLRQLIINKVEPQFDKKLDKQILDRGVKLLSQLNKQQQRAVLKVLQANDYVLVQGMPGCGKTQTIVTLIKLLTLLQKTVLIVSHTHSAVDNILLRLDVPFLRLGSLARINSKLHDNCEVMLTKNCKTTDELEKLYNSFSVVAATCLGSNHELIKKRIFDYCLVDESTQVLQPETLLPLFYCKKFVLIGDQHQLPPVVQNKQAKSLGMDVSLFDHLHDQGGTVMLSTQYRMNQVITDLANKLTYNNELTCANEEVAGRLLHMEPTCTQPWASRAFSVELSHSVVFYNTGYIQSTNEEKPDTLSNIYEVAFIKYIINQFIQNGVESQDIGVIAPYKAQVSLLNKHTGCYNVEVSTVDQYQGRDKEIIIYSCTKSKVGDSIVEFEILNDERRLNVAVTRSRRKLIMIGDVSTLNNYKPFQKLIKCLGEEQMVDLTQSDVGVDWSMLLNQLQHSK